MPTKEELPAFNSRLKKTKKQYPQSSDRIDKIIDSLTTNPGQGERYPGFGELEIRKLHIRLPEYKLGKSNGLRLIHLYIKEKNMVFPLTIYAKKGFGKEQNVLKQVRTAMKEVSTKLKP